MVICEDRPAMSVRIRQVAPQETDEFFRAIDFAFSEIWDPEELELERPLMDPERMVTAEEDRVSVICEVRARKTDGSEYHNQYHWYFEADGSADNPLRTQACSPSGATVT